MKKTSKNRFIYLAFLIGVGIGVLGLRFMISGRTSAPHILSASESEEFKKQQQSPTSDGPSKHALETNNTSSDEVIASIIGDEHLNPEETAARLMDIAVDLDEDGQEKAVHYALRLGRDNQVAVWVKRLADQRLPDKIATALFQQLMTTEEDIQYPILAEIADRPSNALSQQSQTILEGNFGTHPQGVKWSDWIKNKK